MDWIKLYESKGIEALYAVNYGTNKGELRGHTTSIKQMFESKSPHCVKEAMSRIAESTGITRNMTCVRKFIKGLGFRYLKTGHIPAKANKEKQLDFLENKLSVAINSAKEGKTSGSGIIFLDISKKVRAILLHPKTHQILGGLVLFNYLHIYLYLLFCFKNRLSTGLQDYFIRRLRLFAES